jgi:membrane protein implicated in regulation of membrane protease activity
MELLESLEPLLKIYWYIAVPVSIIFFIQLILTFMSGVDVDGFDGDSVEIGADFQFFTLRNLINFLLGFSWTGISFFKIISTPVFLILLSLFVGCLFVYVFFIIISQIQKLAEDNSFKIEDTLNKTAEVYLKIPENKSGKGKIIVSVNGSYHELEAMTEQGIIPTGATVKIIKIENNTIVIVQTI